MKKFFALVVFLALVAISLPHIPAGAEENKNKIDVYEQQKLIKSIVFVIGQNQYFVNNQVQSQDTMDTAPFIENDRTFVPVRFLGHALGIDDNHITWNNELRKAVLVQGNNKAEMVIGQKQIIANDVAQNIDVAPVIRNDRTHLPARYVAEALGYEVDWDNGYVVVWPKGEPKPDITPVKQYVEQQQQPKPEQQPSVNHPVNSQVINGYTIPVGNDIDFCRSLSELTVRKKFIVEVPLDSDNPNGIDISIMLHMGAPLEPQYKYTYNILSSKFGNELAKQVVDYVKQKKDWFNDNLPDKSWTVNNQLIRVGSEKGNFSIPIQVWKPGVK